MISQTNNAQTSGGLAPPSLARLKKICPPSVRTHSRLVVTVLLYVVINAIAAVLEQRADALTAWETWLRIHFGLMLPGLCFTLALDVSRSDADPFDVDATRARYGKNRRALLLPRLLTSLTSGLLVNTGTLLFCRTLSYPAGVACFDRDLLTCVGISTLATTTYIVFFGALSKVGLGRTGAIVALLVDLTLGHANGAWSALAPHRYVTELLGTPGIFLIPAYTSSVILIAIATVATAWIVARTHR